MASEGFDAESLAVKRGVVGGARYGFRVTWIAGLRAQSPGGRQAMAGRGKVLRRRSFAAGLSILAIGLTGCGVGPGEGDAPVGASATSGTHTSGAVSSPAPVPTGGSGSATSSDADGAGTSGSGSGVSDASSDATSPGATSGGAAAGRGSGPSYPVVSVVDGDTIKVRINGRKETVRLVGVDTPETKKPNLPPQCFGKEATSHMQSLVQSKDVQLAADPTQDDRDKYGRLLRYVFVGGKNVAYEQILGGFGREYTYDADYQYQANFQSAQVAAQAAHRGLWGAPCNGFHQADGTQSSDAAPPSETRPSDSGSRVAGDSAASAGTATNGAGQGATGGQGCNIKGNINSAGKKIAHAPGSKTYERTKINRPGERMFCSAAEAIAAGWEMDVPVARSAFP